VEKAQRELARLPAGPGRDKLEEILEVLAIWGLLGKA
jgi:hypothetical protein